MMSNIIKDSLEELRELCKEGDKLTKLNLKKALKKSKPMSAKQIKALRVKELNVSQAVMAEALDVGLSTYTNWENGIANPNGPVLRLLAMVKKNGLTSIL
jgi:DNA-binding transcriptional regulator YiaG